MPTFESEARTAAAQWKKSTAHLPEEAREDGIYVRVDRTYPFCLPARHRVLNLLPDARAEAISRFVAAGIPWHRGHAGLPTTHLLSSQVQCANTLAPFVDDPAGLKQLFGGHLPIDEVLPFGATTHSPFDRVDHVVFEWTGAKDYLGERQGGHGVRGANSTSADAAIRYRALDGATEIALIEWKYVEKYKGHKLSGGKASHAVRLARYPQRLGADAIFNPVVPDDALFLEPFYQLMRLHLLADAMARAKEVGATRVRVLYAAPGRNEALWSSLAAAHQIELADESGVMAPSTSVRATWTAITKDVTSTAWFETAELVAANSPTSNEFKARYGHIAGTT